MDRIWAPPSVIQEEMVSSPGSDVDVDYDNFIIHCSLI